MAVSDDAAVNGIEPRKLCILLDCADAVRHVAGNTGQRAIGERYLGTRGRRPSRASHDVTMVTSEIPVALVRNGTSMPNKLKRRGRQIDEGSRKAA